MISLHSVLLVTIAAVPQLASTLSLDVQNPDSIRSAAKTLAHGLMSFYENNQTTTAPEEVGTLEEPLYWWEAGAVWGGMVDYWAYTGDTSYVETTQQALLAQVGPDKNYMPPAYFDSLGNDDQAFWGIAALAAAEYGFPVPAEESPTLWLDLGKAVFDSQAPRWDTSTCNGGLAWQIFESNVNGMTYKNSISNGAFFQMTARLAYHTGNKTYVDWCEKVWDWMAGVNLIDDNYNVYDGTDIRANCTKVNLVVFSYNPSMMLYGAALLYNHTESPAWQDRTQGLTTACANTFFSPYPNATDIAYEWACEAHGTCNNDQYSFKAYLARWLAKSSSVAPFISDSVFTLLNASSIAAAQSCSGGDSGQLCGQKWYVSGYDGNSGVGQQLSAMETVQSLLLLQGFARPLEMAPSISETIPAVKDDDTRNKSRAEVEQCADDDQTWPC
ncbi:hypothetical protein LTR37_000800 [Vermiconidia calcicola]|uniref:Uncharacterized protein n=1 Tax=Vermiconidia calcicola TaxID=1690605 RepID=A0ACC3NYU4_9PEZI|nr:hypothetical protein LTR37_000800 [Vermiconidia calcicola]